MAGRTGWPGLASPRVSRVTCVKLVDACSRSREARDTHFTLHLRYTTDISVQLGRSTRIARESREKDSFDCLNTPVAATVGMTGRPRQSLGLVRLGGPPVITAEITLQAYVADLWWPGWRPSTEPHAPGQNPPSTATALTPQIRRRACLQDLTFETEPGILPTPDETWLPEAPEHCNRSASCVLRSDAPLMK